MMEILQNPFCFWQVVEIWSTTSHEPFFLGGRVMACSEFLITTSCSEKDLQYLCPHHDCNHLNEPSSKWCQFFFENENDKLQLRTL